MDKETFDSFDPHTKSLIIAPYMEDLKASVRSRIGILPQVAALAATLMVIATLNKELVPLGLVEGRILLTIFLILIPLTLHLYVYDLSKGEEKNVARIEELLGVSVEKEITSKQSFISRIIAYAPKGVTYIFYVLVLYVVIRIWMPVLFDCVCA